MIGTRLGRWVIVRELGRGGMGAVYLARRDPPGEGPSVAAIKVLAPELAVETGFLARFQREIDILRQLDHPHIVRFLESGQEGVHYFYIMEYVPGQSFEEIRTERGRLPWAEVLDLAWQIAPALKHAHDRGIIHRDLKPANLLRAPHKEDGPTDGDSAGHVKLADFGIASLFASPHLTVTGGVVGTAEYLSPEQAAGKPVTRRSDLYSLGVVLYTLLAGRPPFVGEPLDLLHKHRFAQFDRPGRLVRDLPPEFEEVVCELLEKDPARRPADAAVLHRRLDSLKRKLAFRAAAAAEEEADQPVDVSAQETTVHGIGRSRRSSGAARKEEGPATLMSRLMRRELEEERHGGRVRRFFNRGIVLVPLFLLTLGLIVWGLWPTSPETLFRRGAERMESANPEDWEEGWEKYLAPLAEKYPNNAHQDELETYRRKYEAARAERRSALAARRAGPMTEAQWFYQEGVRLRQQGDEAAAQKRWRALVAAFRDVPSEAPWVRLAEQELEKSPDKRAAERQWAPVREAVHQARELREQGKTDEADAILRGLRELYHGDPAAEAILDSEAGGK
jgi:serine/threonine protein kinase